MKKVAIDGGEPVEICKVTHPFGATWTSNDQIFFSNRETDLAQVSAAGGKPVNRAKDSFGGKTLYWPSILPGNKHILVQTFPPSIEVLDLDNSKAKVLIKGGSNPQYVPSGHLVYAQLGRLMAVPFDLERLAVTGSPVPIIDHVRTESLFRAAQYSVSDDGTLVYARGAAAENAEFVMIDRQGAVTETLSLPVGAYGPFALSPNGQRLAYTLGADILIHDITRNMNSRLTLRGNNRAPVWMPDGAQVVFRSDRAGQGNLFLKSRDGREAESLATSDHAMEPTSISLDGKHLLYEGYLPDTKADIWLLPMTGKPVPFLSSEDYEWGPQFSPDGQYVAYTSDESGQFEVYVKPFPATGERWQLSTEGGMQPIWSPKEEELYYRSLSVTEMMVVAVKTKAGFMRQRPRVLFEGNYLDVVGMSYDIYPDGEHFLMLKGTEEGTTRKQLNVVTNWFEELKQKVPVEK